MWIFLNDAFLSIVSHRDRKGGLLVRARRRGDIERVFPEVQVTEMPDADYRFRAAIPKQLVADTLAQKVLGIEYDNFKNSMSGEDVQRHAAYLDVWSDMRRYQERTER